ncbi:putative Zn-dependent peptidase [Frankia casuarinae]|nr:MULTISPECIES: pitrilysin family protein [Frankia]ETA01283.1 putative Zn-dependent peptidase [Frankia sp. CcI6]EYT90337.1 putative Zn-dependent peptidase [Frankia casuarinae]KFB06306.1 putative Zn-dependent peptidase [Frankia sp. Allo2]
MGVLFATGAARRAVALATVSPPREPGPAASTAVKSALPASSYPIERTRLGNGLRVLLAPDHTAPVVAVSVHYDVGFRSEPEGRTGFAHLFEHLMFQGSENVGKAEHPKHVQAAGGIFNGSTHPDYTDYFELLPAGALELALFLEADRMRAPKITRQNLDNQIAVVQEEIRVNVLNRPYGGFPWIKLPPVAFDTFPNAHNGYGDFSELEAASLDDAEDFFDKYYAPGNAVLTIVGDIDPEETLTFVHRYFGDIPARSVPTRVSFAEPVPSTERRAVLTDPLAPRAALAVGYRVPDPIGDLSTYLSYYLLTEILSDGDASRLERRLVQKDRSVIGVSTYLGTFGDPFEQRDPLLLTLEARQSEDASADAVLAAVDEELARLAGEGLADGELERVQARVASSLLRESDDALGRALAMAVHELQRGRPELVNELPAELSAVTGQAVAAAARTLLDQGRSVLELRAGAAS